MISKLLATHSVILSIVAELSQRQKITLEVLEVL